MTKKTTEKLVKLSLKTFIEKAIEHEMKRVKIVEIEVENFGLIEFIRPKEGVLINYLSDALKASNTDKTSGKVETDIKHLLNTASELVYNCCPLLQAKEVRKQYPDREPYDIPAILFGITETIDLAGKLNDVFSMGGTLQAIADEVKN